MDSIRQNKVSRLVQRELSGMFQQGLNRIYKGVLVSVTNVRVTSDLSYAKVYVSIFPSEKADDIMKTLGEKNQTIRYELGQKVGRQMRIIPELRFYVDDSLEYVEKIDNLLK